MTDYEKALADARDALAIYRRYGAPLCGYATNAIDALDDLLAALDAAQGEAALTITNKRGEPVPYYAAPPAAPCVCGEPKLGVVHRADSPCYLPEQAPPAAAAAVPEGMVMVQRADLAALEATDFGRCGWSVRANLAALRLRDVLLAAARKVEP